MINFSDLVVVNFNFIIDFLLIDEWGYNVDIGVCGDVFDGWLRFDVFVFYLCYND